jgi:glycerol-3-phosphate dehydrogenase
LGTLHLPYDGPPEALRVTKQELTALLNGYNRAYPGRPVSLQDVSMVYAGLLPGREGDAPGRSAKLLKHFRVVDHGREDGPKGLISIVGVKFTTARHVAQNAVDLAALRLGKAYAPCRTAATSVYGGDVESFDEFLLQTIQNREACDDPAVLRHLVYYHGSSYPEVLAYVRRPNSSQRLAVDHAVTAGEVRHAVREEMAVRLADVVLRRTPLGAKGYPGDEVVERCAGIMAEELGWDQRRQQSEVQACRKSFNRFFDFVPMEPAPPVEKDLEVVHDQG